MGIALCCRHCADGAWSFGHHCCRDWCPHDFPAHDHLRQVHCRDDLPYLLHFWYPDRGVQLVRQVVCCCAPQQQPLFFCHAHLPSASHMHCSLPQVLPHHSHRAAGRVQRWCHDRLVQGSLHSLAHAQQVCALECAAAGTASGCDRVRDPYPRPDRGMPSAAGACATSS